MSKKITKVTITFEMSDGQLHGWEFTDTDAIPLNPSISWQCEPVRDYEAEAREGNGWMMHKPGPAPEVHVHVSGVAETWTKLATGGIIPTGAPLAIIGENDPS